MYNNVDISVFIYIYIYIYIYNVYIPWELLPSVSLRYLTPRC